MTSSHNQTKDQVDKKFQVKSTQPCIVTHSRIRPIDIQNKNKISTSLVYQDILTQHEMRVKL